MNSLKVGWVGEIDYFTWLSNVVLAPKASGDAWLCIDFIDVNKATPIYCFPLPSKVQLGDATTGLSLMNFMDAYSSYHQIKMHLEDEENTSFIMEDETFCCARIYLGSRMQEQPINAWSTECLIIS